MPSNFNREQAGDMIASLHAEWEHSDRSQDIATLLDEAIALHDEHEKLKAAHATLQAHLDRYVEMDKADLRHAVAEDSRDHPPAPQEDA
jgi:hypothetical protein